MRVFEWLKLEGAVKVIGEIFIFPLKKGKKCITGRSLAKQLSEGTESEHIRWDPKDGELFLSRVKPGETLVEARSGTDVQIVRQTWV